MIVRIADACAPPFPITLPRSSFATRSSSTWACSPTTSLIWTSSGRSTSDCTIAMMSGFIGPSTSAAPFDPPRYPPGHSLEAIAGPGRPPFAQGSALRARDATRKFTAPLRPAGLCPQGAAAAPLEHGGSEADLEGGAVLGEVVRAEVAAVGPVAVAHDDLGRARDLVAHARLAAAEEVDRAERGVVEAGAEEPDRDRRPPPEVALDLDARVGLHEAAALEVRAPVMARGDGPHEPAWQLGAQLRAQLRARPVAQPGEVEPARAAADLEARAAAPREPNTDAPADVRVVGVRRVLERAVAALRAHEALHPARHRALDFEVAAPAGVVRLEVAVDGAAADRLREVLAHEVAALDADLELALARQRAPVAQRPVEQVRLHEVHAVVLGPPEAERARRPGIRDAEPEPRQELDLGVAADARKLVRKVRLVAGVAADVGAEVGSRLEARRVIVDLHARAQPGADARIVAVALALRVVVRADRRLHRRAEREELRLAFRGGAADERQEPRRRQRREPRPPPCSPPRHAQSSDGRTGESGRRSGRSDAPGSVSTSTTGDAFGRDPASLRSKPFASSTSSERWSTRRATDCGTGESGA